MLRPFRQPPDQHSAGIAIFSLIYRNIKRAAPVKIGGNVVDCGSSRLQQARAARPLTASNTDLALAQPVMAVALQRRQEEVENAALPGLDLDGDGFAGLQRNFLVANPHRRLIERDPGDIG